VTTTTFADLGVPAPLVAALAADGKTEPFPIQTDTLPDTLAGRDVLGRGKTGSGKTIAFSLPLVTRLGDGSKRRASRPRGLVLAPTRELATQIAATLQPLADAAGMRITTVFGGVSQNRQVEALRGGVDILVACPGRLEDLMKQKLVSLDGVEITVLDEADHMADLGFLPVVTRILSATPAGGQRLLFSATLDNGVDKLVARFMSSPVMHSVDDETSPVEAMTHHVFEVASADDKKDLVNMLASGRGKRILFMRTKHHAKRLAKQLTAAGIPAVDLHGNLSQPARDRNLARFGSGEVRVLVATDVAARGVHVDEVELVVHVDPPAEHKAYLHRSGRTARAGSSGDVVTVMLPEQAGDVRSLLRAAAITATPQKVSATHAAVVELVGERAERVAPEVAAAAAAAAAASTGTGGGAGRGGRGGASAGGAGGARGAGGGRGRSRGARSGEAGGAEVRAAGGAGRASAGERAGRERAGGAAGAASAGGGRRRRGGRGRGASGAEQASGGANSAQPRRDAATGGEQRRRGNAATQGHSGRGAAGGGHGSTGGSGSSAGSRGGMRVGQLVDGSTRRGNGTRRARG
jgi:superfamily II DNA/RNA helicase